MLVSLGLGFVTFFLESLFVLEGVCGILSRECQGGGGGVWGGHPDWYNRKVFL